MTGQENPLVTIIINTYYRNDTLVDAVESALAQTYDNVEILVVDDSGEGHARPAISSYDVEFVELQENKGLNGARNVGIGRANGEYIAFLDDDDTFYPEKTEKQLELIQQCDDIGVVYSGFELETGTDVLPDPTVTDAMNEHLLTFRIQTLKPSTALIDTEALTQVLPLVDRPAATDLGMWIELAQVTEFDFVDEILTFRGVDEDSLGRSAEARAEIFNIIEEYDYVYEQYPSQVRNKALSSAYFRQGRHRLKQRAWSRSAISSLAKSLYLDPTFDTERVGYFVLSLFGKPGYIAGTSMYNAVVADGA